MKKGLVRIIIGSILIAFQVLGMIGNLRTQGVLIPPYPETGGYDLGYVFGYFLIGIVGAILLTFGIQARNKYSDEQ